MRKDHDESAEPVGPALIVTYGNTTRRRRPLDRDVFLLGRSTACDLALVSPEVAPVHCVLSRRPDGWWLRDCSVRPGTLVNGQLVQGEGRLGDEDTLQVGAFTFQLCLPAVEGAEPAPVAARLEAPVAALAQEQPYREEAAVPAARLAEVEQQSEALRQAQAELDERVAQLTEDEQTLAAEREALERDEKELRQMRGRIEREVEQRRKEAEAQAQALKDEVRKRCQAIEEECRRRCRKAEKTHAARLAALPAPAATADAVTLDRRRAELECFARHLRRQRDRLARAAGQSAEVARLRDEVERLRQEAAAAPRPSSGEADAWRREVERLRGELASRRDTIPDGPAPVRSAELEQVSQEARQAREAAALFQNELAALAADLAEAQARLSEESANAASFRKQAEIALANEEDLRTRLERLERDLGERDGLIEKMQAKQEANPWDTQALSAVEMELNRFRMELDRDRRELEENMRQLRQGQEDLQQARLESELEMSRERAQMARERAELNRIREEVRRDQEKLQRDRGSRNRLSPRRFKEELLNGRDSKA
jgi:pSer/pThr/pTyr-binding forkhead associated (FHA) protein